MSKYTLAHVTHEAVDKLGGIGTVLEGLMTSPVYKDAVGRSILIGPCSVAHGTPETRLGEHGKVLYSGVDKIDVLGLAPKFHPIEWAFDVSIIYGTRTYDIPGDERTGEAEVILIDIFRANKERLALFKLRLAEVFGIDSLRYEHEWGFEEYVRLAEPAFYALAALLNDQHKPCVIFSHEFMGLATAFKAQLDGQGQFRTLFHAHECSTARHLVENHPGHDLMFYNVMRQATTSKPRKYAEDVFGDLSYHFRHKLISNAHTCDGIIAVGDDTARELHFLGKHFDHHQIDLVYNGVPAPKVTAAQKNKSRKMLLDYSEKLVGYRPTHLMTHVMRPVISKGLWRDLQVLHELEQRFEENDETAILYVLTTAGGTRRPQDIRSMEEEYGWPRKHREGFPDLVGPEVDFGRMIDAFNRGHKRSQIVLVNQFGWSSERIGERLPKDMDIADFRFATDVEFGMATYEPFGISPLEPLCAGAICCITNVCGCAGFVNEVTKNKPVPNVLIADYTRLDRGYTLDALLKMTQAQRDPIEQRISGEVAADLYNRLPRSDADRKKLLESGQKLAKAMGWDFIVEHHLLPMLHRVVNSTRAGK
jgi:hypothetical protein